MNLGEDLRKEKYINPGTQFVVYQYNGNEAYFEKIFKEAYEAEGRKPLPMRFYYHIEIDHIIYISIPITPYNRVSRRINFRLQNNQWIEKKTIREGIDFVKASRTA